MESKSFHFSFDIAGRPCPRGYITITCLHKSAGWSVGTTNQNHSAKNKINTTGRTWAYLKTKNDKIDTKTGEYRVFAKTLVMANIKKKRNY